MDAASIPSADLPTRNYTIQIFNVLQFFSSFRRHCLIFLLSILDAWCSECPTILVSAVITLQEAPFILDSSPDRNQGWLLDLPLLGKNTNYSMSVSLTRLDPSVDEVDFTFIRGLHKQHKINIKS